MSALARPHLPPVPRIHGKPGGTFKMPPLDGSLALPELYEWHAEHSPDHPLFVFAREDGSVRKLCWPEVLRAVYTGVKIIRDRAHWQPGMTKAPVVAILSNSDSVPYATTTMAIMRANCTAFLISSRNSPAAVAHLLDKVGAKHLLVGDEPSMHGLCKESLDLLKTQYSEATVPETSSMLGFEELYLPVSQSPSREDVPYEYKGAEEPVVILHSSGSTAFPKPIVMTNRRLNEHILSPCFSEVDLAGRIISMHTLPMFHVMGMLMTTWAVSTGLIPGLPAPKHPPAILTPDLVLDQAKATGSDILVTVPAIVEAWSKTPANVKYLATRQGIVYGGGPLNKEIGDELVSKGVTLVNLYGSTETGAQCIFMPAHVGDEWEYLRLPGNVTTHMAPMGEGTYELIVIANDFGCPSLLNTKFDGKDAYATSDLFLEHPTKKGHWKVIGRTDDQIMHSTGEKTNPGPLEAIMNLDPHVAASVMFGRGRFQAGILIEPKLQYRFDPSDEAKLIDFRNKIWPTVEKMNEYAPQHSRLFKEMILVASPSKPFLYTAKSTVRRGAVIKEYETEINALYDTVDASAQSSIPPPTEWTLPTTTEYVRTVVHKVMTHAVTDNDDIFQHGCDSLQATYIRNTILRAFRDTTKVDTHKIVGSFVYDHPTISSLAAFVSSVAQGTHHSATAGLTASARILAMQAMLAKYSADFPARPRTLLPSQPEQDAVFVTGTTGSIGCHILAFLVADPKVGRVYAFNRPAKTQTHLCERQKSALVDRGLDASIADSEKVVLLEGSLTAENWGVGKNAYEELHKSVTHIIHNAWRVDFVIKLESFEDSIAGVRRLVDFALTSPLPQPPRVLFESSIGVFQNSPCDVIFAEGPLEPDLAIGTGYAESKWVSEQTLYAAASKTSLDTLVVRVGQVCGGLDGLWNTHEWFPTLVQSATKLGCFPDDDKDVNWIPLEIAAEAIADFRNASNPTHTVHLVHPRPVSWHSLATVVSSELGVPLVPYAEWLAKLVYTAQTYEQNGHADPEIVRGLRALQLLGFFQALAETSSTARMSMGLPDLEVKQAIAGSPTLGAPDLRQLGGADVKRWLAYWRRVELF